MLIKSAGCLIRLAAVLHAVGDVQLQRLHKRQWSYLKIQNRMKLKMEIDSIESSEEEVESSTYLLSVTPLRIELPASKLLQAVTSLAAFSMADHEESFASSSGRARSGRSSRHGRCLFGRDSESANSLTVVLYFLWVYTFSHSR